MAALNTNLQKKPYYFETEQASPAEILEDNDICFAIRALANYPYRDTCLFLADVAESVMYVYKKYSDDDTPIRCIQAIRAYSDGNQPIEHLEPFKRYTYDIRAAPRQINIDSNVSTRLTRLITHAVDSAAYTAYIASDSLLVDYPWQVFRSAVYCEVYLKQATESVIKNTSQIERTKLAEIEALYINRFCK